MMAQSEAAPAVANCSGSTFESTSRIEADGASNDQGYVYCIAEYDEKGKETGYIKVGTAYEPEKRLAGLQTGNPRPLKIWRESRLVSKRLDAEKAAHKHLEKYKANVGGGTEWFMVPLSERDKFYDLFCEATEQYLVK